MSRQIARTVLGRMTGGEAMIAAQFAHSCLSDLRQLASVTDETLEEAAAERQRAHMLDAYGYRPMAQSKPFAFANGVAIIPVHGTLINRFAYSWGFVTGYSFIRSQFNAAAADPDVELIVLDVNSYGGEAAGCFELSAEIKAAEKQVLAVVDSNCCSAAYAIASAANRLVVTPSGQAGSIGVISMHVNVQRALEDAGIEVTIVAEGPRKADGNPYERLSPEALRDIQASVAKRYGEFIDLVVKNRGLSAEAVRDTESRCYRADDALELNLIDAVQTPTEAVASFLAEMGSDEPDLDEDDYMSEQNQSGQGANQAAPTDNTAAVNAAVTAERQRMDGILNCEEAKARPALAKHLATKTGMSVDEARAMLAVAAEEQGASPAPAQPAQTGQGQGQTAEGANASQAAASGTSAFKQAMNSSEQPNVGADPVDGGESGEEAKGPSRAQRAMAAAGMKKEERATKH